MIKVEGFKAFHGTMQIKPMNRAPYTLTCDWLYRPDTECWYGEGRSFCKNICEIIGEVK